MLCCIKISEWLEERRGTVCCLFVVTLVTVYHPEATLSLRLKPGQNIRPFHALSVSCVDIFVRRSFKVP